MKRQNLIHRLATLILVASMLALSAPVTLAAPARTGTVPSGCTVVGWGDNSMGELDFPAGLSDVTAISTGRLLSSGFALFSLALKSDGTVVGWGYDWDTGAATPPAGLSGVVAIAAGLDHSLALLSDGTVVGWGGDYWGQATPPAGLTEVVAISTGGMHSLALKSDGTVVGWGWNEHGQATPPAGLSGVVAISAGVMHSLALLSDGTVVGWGNTYSYGAETPPEGLSGVVAIAAGQTHSLALKSDGTVVGWGDTQGNGAETPPADLTDVVAIAAGAIHSLALKSDGTVVGWGDDSYGQATPPEGLSHVVAIAAGTLHSLALQCTAAPNQPPVIAANNASVTVNEGQTASNTGTVSDPDGDAVTLSASVGTVVNNGDGTWSWSLVTTAPGTQTITITANDGKGGVSQTTFDLTVRAPLPINARINGTDCNLIDAITAANTDTATGACAAGHPGADTIQLLSDVTLANGLPAIASAITIEGGGHTIARDAGAPGFSILTIDSTGNLTLNTATLTGGNAGYGGGILNGGALTLNNSTVSGNAAGIYGGGGIYNSGAATLNDSTVSGNTASGAGGGINNGGGTLTLNNSTVSGNTANDLGGGIFNPYNGSAALNNSTVSGNTTDMEGGGIYSEGELTLAASLVSGNTAPGWGNEVVSYATATSLGHNLFGHSGESTGEAIYGIALGAGDITAASDGSQPTALAAILGPLANNGGSTKTHALVAGSPAVNAAPTGPATDQRGVARPQCGGFDIGAFELESPSCAPANQPPVAHDDSYTTDEDTALTVAAPGVLGNDTDADGNALTAVLVAGPAHGTLTLNADGSFTYMPAANYNGPDSFTYKANDGAADSNVATVTLTINAVNDAPVAANDSYSTNEDTALTVPAPGVLGNDTDVDGNPLTAILVSGSSHGTLTLNADGSFTYTPAPDYYGPDSFTYKANDGQADSNIATVTLTVNPVNDAPVANDDTFGTNEDTALTVPAPGVLGNDTDAEYSPLTAALVTGPAHGTLTLNANGSFTYAPAANYNGPDSFTYKAYDGALYSGVATVALTVNPVNDAPVAVGDSYITNEDTALTVAAPGVLGNDTDMDGNPLTAHLVDTPNHGTLTLNANGSFTYTPAPDYAGPDSFTYQANDGEADSNVATVSLTVVSVNDAPVCTAATVTPSVLWPANHKWETIILGGFSDVDGDTLSITIASIRQDEPTNGLGDGDTSPDGQGVGTATAQVRAERSGNGNGRYYHIGFTVGDGRGGSCTGTVKVSVPKSMGKNGAAVDDGPLYNSTLP